MERRFGWRSGGVGAVAGALFLALACVGDSVTAPDACPAYCATVGFEARDTVLSGTIRGDSSHRGYQFALSASEVQVAGSGGVSEARGVVRFLRFPMRIAVGANDTTTSAIQSVDSLRVGLSLRRRTAGAVQMAVYRLPRGTDTLITYDSATPFFQDSTKVLEFTVTPDTGLVQATIPVSALPTLEADSFDIVLGFAIASPDTANVRLGSNEGGFGAFLERFTQVDSGTTRIKRTDTRIAQFDTFLFQDLAAPLAGVLAVGGAPSARVLMRVGLPRRIIDSSSVVRATLLLIPAGPALSAAGDTLRVLVHALAGRDIGPKSPLAVTTLDNDVRAGGYIPPGSADTIRIDITHVLQLWRADTLLHRTVVLRANPEGATLSEIRFWSSTDVARRPLVHVTYVPPFAFGAR